MRLRLRLLLVPLYALVSACVAAPGIVHPRTGVVGEGVTSVSGRHVVLISRAIEQTISERERDASPEDFTVTLAEAGGVTTIYLARGHDPDVEGGVPRSPSLYTVIVAPEGLTVLSGFGEFGSRR